MSWGDIVNAAKTAGQERRRIKEKEVALDHEVGMGAIGIEQQDLNLDKAAWDFAQGRYNQFGQHADRMGLATSALATRGAMQDFDMEPSEDFWEPYAGMFEEGAPEFSPDITARRRQRPNTARPNLRSAAGGLGLYEVPERNLPAQGAFSSQSRRSDQAPIAPEDFEGLLRNTPNPFEALYGTIARYLR